MEVFLRPQFLLLALISAVVFLFSLIFPELGFQSFALGIFIVVFLVNALIPVRWGLFFAFIYIGLEGFLKVVSNYHPLIHIGSDILVLFLCAKIILETFSRGELFPAQAPPLWTLFLLHFAWLLAVLFNPYSLGFIASIAGSKVYITMLLLFFFGFYQVKSIKDIQFFFAPLLIVGLAHTIFGIYQGMVGAESVLSLHPGFALQLAKYQKTAFRPFGLTNLPGGPAVYLAPIFPILLYFIFTVRSEIVRLILIAYLPLGTFLFFLCQVRSSLVKMIVGSAIFVIFSFILFAKKMMSLRSMIFSGIVIAGCIIYAIPQLMAISVETNAANEDAFERSLTTFDIETLTSARRGTWDRFIKYAQDVPFGAGFSRVGAAAGKFQDLQKYDPFFAENYFFSDNFWLACLIEIGFPGMFLMTFILVGIVYYGIRAVRFQADEDKRILSLALLASIFSIIIGLYGSEGILYNPESSFFWFFSGVMLKLPYLDRVE